MHCVSFLKIVLEHFIKKARDLQSKATDDLARGQVFGYSFIITRILNDAIANDLLDYLPDHLKNFDYKTLLDFPEASKQQQ